MSRLCDDLRKGVAIQYHLAVVATPDARGVAHAAKYVSGC